MLIERVEHIGNIVCSEMMRCYLNSDFLSLSRDVKESSHGLMVCCQSDIRILETEAVPPVESTFW